jgi:ABC-type sugar transport system ATPase subunit
MTAEVAAPMIKASAVNKYFGDLHVLREITLEVPRGRVGQVDPVPGDQPPRADQLG